MVSAPFSQRAATARGSSGTPASRVWRTSSATTRWAAAKARSGSPVLTVYVKQRLSSRPITGGAPAASAASGSATPGSGVHSTRTSPAASWASTAESATTAATGVPWHRTTSFAT